jgi:putative flippase GtrA
MIIGLSDWFSGAIRNSTLVKFGAVGAFTTCMDIAFFSVLLNWFHFAPATSNAFSYCCMVVISFLLNRFWTFTQNNVGKSIVQEALRFGFVHVIAVALSTSIVWLLTLFVHPIAAKLVSVPVVLIWNYLAAKNWVFRLDAKGHGD